MNLLLIEASSFVHRAFHALPPLTRPSDGQPVGAVAGFSQMLWNILNYGAHASVPRMPSHVAVVFDPPGRTFRHDLYSQYKGNRPERSAELTSQFPLVRDAVKAFGLPAVEVPGFEADDVIASCVAAQRVRDEGTVILSSDKDLMQLIGPDVVMVDTMRNRLIDAEAVKKQFGVEPHQIVDYLALVGDTSDNIPGVPQIGAKTAAKLLALHGSLDVLLAKPEATNFRLVPHAQSIDVARRLLRLDSSLPVDISSFAWSGAIETGPILEFCDRMELVSLRLKIERALEAAA